MTIKITSMKITDRALGTVRMTATDCSEEHAQYLERYRDDGFEKELVYEWNTKDPTQQYWFRWWLKRQKATKDAKTFGEAMEKVIGTIVDSPSNRYRVWE